MKLAPPGVDPHVGVGHHQIGIAGEPKSRDVEQGRQALIGHLDVDVLEMDGVAEIFCGSIELLRHGYALRLKGRIGHTRAEFPPAETIRRSHLDGRASCPLPPCRGRQSL
jgi:hypothetical protein